MLNVNAPPTKDNDEDEEGKENTREGEEGMSNLCRRLRLMWRDEEEMVGKRGRTRPAVAKVPIVGGLGGFGMWIRLRTG